jgi:hypothetical protein
MSDLNEMINFERARRRALGLDIGNWYIGVLFGVGLGEPANPMVRNPPEGALIRETFRPAAEPPADLPVGLDAAVLDALEESVKLQSHYAALLNDYDGGERMQFASAKAWIDRLEFIRKTNPLPAKETTP